MIHTWPVRYLPFERRWVIVNHTLRLRFTPWGYNSHLGVTIHTLGLGFTPVPCGICRSDMPHLTPDRYFCILCDHSETVEISYCCKQGYEWVTWAEGCVAVANTSELQNSVSQTCEKSIRYSMHAIRFTVTDRVRW